MPIPPAEPLLSRVSVTAVAISGTRTPGPTSVPQTAATFATVDGSGEYHDDEHDGEHDDEHDDNANENENENDDDTSWDHCFSAGAEATRAGAGGRAGSGGPGQPTNVLPPSLNYPPKPISSSISRSTPIASASADVPRTQARTGHGNAVACKNLNNDLKGNNNHKSKSKKTKTKTKTRTRTINLIEIHTPLLFDSLARVLVPDRVVWVDKGTGVIIKVCGEGEGEVKTHRRRRKDVQVQVHIEKIILEEGTVLVPGLVDVHVHLFLHPYTETPWTAQLTREPLAERVVRATVHARKTLLSGFTSVRDLGTEGALDADLALRTCMAGRTPLIPGPRYYCATRAIVASGAYGPKNALYPAQDGVDGIVGAVPVDGVDNCVREVRRQIGTGADWIKIYADYTPLAQTPLSAIAPSLASRVIPTFEREELCAMINAAHRWGIKVAVHANSAGVVGEVVRLGVDSVEHGGGIVLDSDSDSDGNDDGDGKRREKDTVLRQLARAGGKTVWVPTLAAYYTTSLNGTKRARKQWEICERTFRRAVNLVLDDDDDDDDHREKEPNDRPEYEKLEEDPKTNRQMDNIAVGGDTGVFAHGTNALEMVLMRRLGAGWERVLAWATIGGWRCVRGMEWEGREGRERVRVLDRRAGDVGECVWGAGRDEEEEGDDDDDEADDDDDDDEDDEEEEEDIELDRGVPFGAIRVGWAADLVAVRGKVDGTPEEFESAFMHGVVFVMKGGLVYKRDGREVVQAQG